jgi:hypothetical protein
MKIHSSSLAFSPINLNQKTGKGSDAQNDDLSLPKEAKNQTINQPSSPEHIEKTLDKANLAIDFTTKNIIKPTDSRTLRALSAYNQQFNAPLQDQRTQLISGIDIYA